VLRDENCISAAAITSLLAVAAFERLLDAIGVPGRAVVLLLTLGAIAAPFVFPDDVDRLYLLVPFAFGLLVAPGLCIELIVAIARFGTARLKRRRELHSSVNGPIQTFLPPNVRDPQPFEGHGRSRRQPVGRGTGS
jgi:hypothetical protein